MADIKDAIIKAMSHAQMSQAELSRRSGVSKSSLSRYLGGDDIPASKLMLIADALSISVDALMGISRPVDLSPEEQELVSLYRASNVHGREQMMIYARGCAATYPLNQAVSASA